MIPSILGSWFKNKLDKLWIKERQRIEQDYAKKQSEFTDSFEKKIKETETLLLDRLEIVEKQKRDLEDLEKRQLDRKSELERSNRELREQIRIIEAKAKPDRIWESSFTLGFSKAWDMMVPIMNSGFKKLEEGIRNQEIDKSLTRLPIMVNQKIDDLKLYELRDISLIISKKTEFESRKASSNDSEEIKKMENYLSLINWILEKRNGN